MKEVCKKGFDSTVYLVIANLSKKGISCRVIQREAKRGPSTYKTDSKRVIKMSKLGVFESHTLSTSPSCFAYTDNPEDVGLLVAAATERLRNAALDLFTHYFDQLEGSKKPASVSFSKTEDY